MRYPCPLHWPSPVRILLVLALLTPILARPAAAAPPSPLVVQGVGNPTATLSGPWQFHLGDDPAWASPAFDDSAWEHLSAARPWGAQTHFNYTGYAWYRLHIHFVPTPGADPHLSLLVPPVSDVAQAWWNGIPIGSIGRFPPHESWPAYLQPVTFPLGAATSGVLVFRIWKAPYVSFGSGTDGGFLGAPVLGTPAAIAAYRDQRYYVHLLHRLFNNGQLLVFTLVGLLSLFAWLRQRSRKLLLAMAVFTLAPAVTGVFGGSLPTSLPYMLSLGILQPVLSITTIALWFLLVYLLELDTRPGILRWTRILAGISLISMTLDGALTAVPWSGHLQLLQQADALLTVVFTVVEIYPVVLVLLALRKRLDLARWLVAIFAMLLEMFLVAQTALSQGERFTHWTIAGKMSLPLFTLGGTPFTIYTILTTLLFLSIIYAVFSFSARQTERQAALEQEFRSAQELQRVLIPEDLPALPGFAVTSAYRPALEVGGDFFQLIANPIGQQDGSALLILGDVSGKGLKAAMTVSLIVGTLRTLAELFTDPAEILAGLNRRLHGRLTNGFVTCLVLRLDPGGNCTLASAGHPAPFLNAREIPLPAALPLGVDPSARYEETSLHLAIGDRLTLYTDGLLEARKPTGELFGYDRLHALIASNPSAHQATEAAIAFGQDDDITVLTLTRLATGMESTTSLHAPTLVTASA